MAKRGAKLGTSVLGLEVDDSQFTAGLDKNKRKAQRWTDSLGKDVKQGLAQGIGIAGALGVAGAVSAAIGGVQQVVAGSIAAAMEWESAFAGVRKTVDASETEFAELEGAIRGMSKEIPIGTTELAGLAEAAGALGVAKKDILEFTRITAMIGTTTDVSSDQAATSLGQLSNVLGLTGDDYERFGSTLVDLGNKGASTESQILEIASRAGAGSKLIGMANDETLAWASSVANLGIEVEAGGSALQKFFLDSAKAVSEGSDKLETYARVAGTTGTAFKKAFEEDASGALQTFLAGLGELSQGDQLKVLEELDFNDVRITRTLLGLAGNTDNLTNSLDVASVAWEENTALVAEAEKRYGTTESKLKILENRVNDLAITFGEELLPHLATLATWGVEQLEQFAGEAGTLARETGAFTQNIASHFGEQGDAVNALADQMVVDFGVVLAAITAYQLETGASFDAALEAVETYGTDNTVALEEAAHGWAAYADMVAGRTSGVVVDVEAGVAGTEAALLAGEGAIGAAAEVALTPIEEAAKKARDEAVAAMGQMLASITSMFDTDESVQDAYQALLDRMDDPYTEAERKADIFSQNMLTLISKALESDDPGAVSETTAFVNRMLAEFALMEPGALESGEAVPPAIRAGMDAEMSALITWIEENVTHESLAAMEIDAVPEGLEAIASYARGMRTNALVAAAEGRYVAGRAKLALEEPDFYGGGRSSGLTWSAGLKSAYGASYAAGVVLASGAGLSLRGKSPPKEGPLKDIDLDALRIGLAWAGGLGQAGGAVEAIAQVLAGKASDALDFLPRIGMPAMPGLAGLGTHAAGMGGVAGSVSNVSYHWELNVEGTERTVSTKREALDELERMSTSWG